MKQLFIRIPKQITIKFIFVFICFIFVLKLQQVKALYNFESDDAQELTFKQNDVITLTGRPHADWWEGEIRAPTGTRRGIFPKNYVKELDPHMH